MKISNIAYIRVSSSDQNTARQECWPVKIDYTFLDKSTGSNVDRPELQRMLTKLITGDHIYVQSMDRLSRSIKDMHELIEIIVRASASITFVKESMTFTGDDSPMNKLMLSLLTSIYEFERDISKARQREGIEAAKLRGVYTGSKNRINRQLIGQHLESGLSIRKTAVKCGCAIASVQTVKKELLSGELTLKEYDKLSFGVV